jgi:hypothetical protein
MLVMVLLVMVVVVVLLVVVVGGGPGPTSGNVDLSPLHPLHPLPPPSPRCPPCSHPILPPTGPFVGLPGVLTPGGGSCVYVCGVPGTGKTASVQAAMRGLGQEAEEVSAHAGDGAPHAGGWQVRPANGLEPRALSVFDAGAARHLRASAARQRSGATSVERL